MAAVATPRKELVELVAVLYPILLSRTDARVPILKYVHTQLLVWAWYTPQNRGRSRARRWYRMDPQDWADMALRVMLEYERDGY